MSCMLDLMELWPGMEISLKPISNSIIAKKVLHGLLNIASRLELGTGPAQI